MLRPSYTTLPRLRYTVSERRGPTEKYAKALGLSPFQEQFFRAGHAHAGVLLLLALLYHSFLEQTSLPAGVKVGAALVLLVAILAQSGGFFLHMVIGKPGEASWGTTMTTIGAALLASAILFLVYGLITAKSAT